MYHVIFCYCSLYGIVNFYNVVSLLLLLSYSRHPIAILLEEVLKALLLCFYISFIYYFLLHSVFSISKMQTASYNATITIVILYLLWSDADGQF